MPGLKNDSFAARKYLLASKIGSLIVTEALEI